MLAPLQQAEAIDIRRKSDAFGEKVEDFRKFFQQKAPFSVPGGELKLEHVSITRPLQNAQQVSLRRPFHHQPLMFHDPLLCYIVLCCKITQLVTYAPACFCQLTTICHALHLNFFDTAIKSHQAAMHASDALCLQLTED